jgi:hypothetical protein
MICDSAFVGIHAPDKFIPKQLKVVQRRSTLFSWCKQSHTCSKYFQHSLILKPLACYEDVLITQDKSFGCMYWFLMYIHIDTLVLSYNTSGCIPSSRYRSIYNRIFTVHIHSSRNTQSWINVLNLHQPCKCPLLLNTKLRSWFIGSLCDAVHTLCSWLMVGGFK